MVSEYFSVNRFSSLVFNGIPEHLAFLLVYLYERYIFENPNFQIAILPMF